MQSISLISALWALSNWFRDRERKRPNTSKPIIMTPYRRPLFNLRKKIDSNSGYKSLTLLVIQKTATKGRGREPESKRHLPDLYTFRKALCDFIFSWNYHTLFLCDWNKNSGPTCLENFTSSWTEFYFRNKLEAIFYM